MDFAGVAGIMAAEQDVMILGGVVMTFFLILLFISPRVASAHLFSFIQLLI